MENLTRRCPKCSSFNAQEVNFCPKCGLGLLPSKAIWKFKLEMKQGVQNIDVRESDELLPTIQMGIDGDIYVYFLVNPADKFHTVKRFVIKGTGWDCSDISSYKYLGTVSKSSFVWHVFYK